MTPSQETRQRKIPSGWARVSSGLVGYEADVIGGSFLMKNTKIFSIKLKLHLEQEIITNYKINKPDV